MFSKYNFRKIPVAMLTIAVLLSSSFISHVQAISKTPNFSTNQGTSLEAGENYQMPEDYPSDILEWFDQNTDARSYIVVDQETNRVLAGKEATTPYPIASMSKIISVYLIYQAIDEGKLTMDQEITIDQKIYDLFTANPNLSNVGLVAGESYTVEDLLNAVLLASGNDATSALMWEIYGNEETAVKAMSDLLHSWGITNFELVTVSGTPNEELPEEVWIPGSNESSENTLSAADIALVGQHLVTDYPQVTDITNADTYQFKAGTDLEMTLSNPNLLRSGYQFGRPGITGLKSGFTDEAGKCFIATGSENDRPIVAVAMGVFPDPNRPDLDMSSYWEIQILLDKLAEYPDLYQNDKLPNNLPKNQVEEEKEEKSSGEGSDSEKHLENKRDNGLTKAMRDLFSIFN